MVSSKERTLIDLIYFNRPVGGIEAAGEIFRRFVTEKKCNVKKLVECADKFDLIHNNFDFLPLTYSALTATPVVTTIHGVPSPSILPVYKKYNGKVFYVATSNADRSPELDYLATIHHGKWVEKCFNADKMVEKYIKVYQ